MTAKRLRDLTIEIVPIDSIKPYERNPRRGDLDEIQASLRYHGQYKPIVVRKQTKEILVGNHTWHAAKAEGWADIAIVRRSVPSDDDAAKIVLVDNRTSDLAGYDEPELASLLQDLPDLEGTGFDPGDMDKMLAEFAGGLDDPHPPELPTDPTTRTGDILTLGRHRLVCGDARDAKVWRALTEGDPPAALLWTDPPYGIDLGPTAAARGRDHGDMAGDGNDDQALAQLTHDVLRLARDHSRPGASAYVCHADTKRAIIAAAFTAAGYYHAQTLVWTKDTLVLGRQDYQWRHEPILYGWSPGATHTWNGERDKTTVIEHPTRSALEALTHEDLVDIAWKLLEHQPGTIVNATRPRVAEHHPTSKPVDLIAPQLRYSSDPEDLVLDPFGGSGSTLIAAEQTNRTARLIEIEPGYCDVTLERWAELQPDDTPMRQRGRGRPKPA